MTCEASARRGDTALVGSGGLPTGSSHPHWSDCRGRAHPKTARSNESLSAGQFLEKRLTREGRDLTEFLAVDALLDRSLQFVHLAEGLRSDEIGTIFGLARVADLHARTQKMPRECGAATWYTVQVTTYFDGALAYVITFPSSPQSGGIRGTLTQ
jgi:hypothetical protein